MSSDLEVTVVVPGDLADGLRKQKVDDLRVLDELANGHNAYTTDVDHRAGCLLAAAVKRAPRPIEVGDTVRHHFIEFDGQEDLAVVLVIDGDEAGLKWRGAAFHSWAHLDELTRVDPDREEAPQ